ncbi:cysteine-rich with EGF-like domain protein 2, partial [Asbolus verrucosus]
MIIKLILVYCIINITSNIHYVSSAIKENSAKPTKLPPCRACKVFVESFKRIVALICIMGKIAPLVKDSLIIFVAITASVKVQELGKEMDNDIQDKLVINVLKITMKPIKMTKKYYVQSVMYHAVDIAPKLDQLVTNNNFQIAVSQGWIMTEDKGCLDFNECASSNNPCKKNHFCVNTEGSYKCLDCDKSCAGCTGDGPDMCIQCASGYILIDNMCTDGEQVSRKQRVFFTRYMTYLGLCIATCIIFNKNTVLAAVIGIAVAVYISISEYVLNTPPTPKTDDLAQQLLNS